MRAGVGALVMIDGDEIHLSNLNRQLHALESTIGRPKVNVMRERLLDINPRCHIQAIKEFYRPEREEELLGSGYDYVVDAIDMVPAKVSLIQACLRRQIPIVSAMGAGNKLDPTRFQVADISRTHTDPLARVIRRKLRQAGIREGLKVVFSTEPPHSPVATAERSVTEQASGFSEADESWESGPSSRRVVPGSISFVPSVAGLILAAVVVNDLLGTAAVRTTG